MTSRRVARGLPIQLGLLGMLAALTIGTDVSAVRVMAGLLCGGFGALAGRVICDTLEEEERRRRILRSRALLERLISRERGRS